MNKLRHGISLWKYFVLNLRARMLSLNIQPTNSPLEYSGTGHHVAPQLGNANSK